MMSQAIPISWDAVTSQVIPISLWAPVTSQQITFYNVKDPYYQLSNFYRRPINVNGKEWVTAEHYFQAQKFIRYPILMNEIENKISPKDAFNVACVNNKYKRSDWDNVKYEIMREALYEKFTQYADLKQVLKATGNRGLVEKLDDSYWKEECEKRQNIVGILLMEIREQI